MKKTTTPAEGRGVSGGPVREASACVPLPFTILEATSCSFGSKCATARLEIPGLGLLDVEMFRPATKPVFVDGASVRCKYTGRYVRAAQLDPDFAAAVLEALEARLAEDT